MDQSKETTRGVKNLIAFYEAMSSHGNRITVLKSEKVISKVPEKVYEKKLINKSIFLTNNDKCEDEKTEVVVKIQYNGNDHNQISDNDTIVVQEKKTEYNRDQCKAVKENIFVEFNDIEPDNIFKPNKTEKGKYKENFDFTKLNTTIFIKEYEKSKSNGDLEADKNASKDENKLHHTELNNTEFNNNEFNNNEFNNTEFNNTKFNNTEFNNANSKQILDNPDRNVDRKTVKEKLIEKQSIEIKNIPGVKNSIEKSNINIEISNFLKQLTIKNRKSLICKNKDFEKWFYGESSLNTEVSKNKKEEIPNDRANDDSLEFRILK
ncbi:hypothetical protein DMUE_2181 [Dictyocoela muelleri]|nr:hypothetical protein DMUE_2181 [Dictyocoela muelleri]